MIRKFALILGVMLLLVTACQSKTEPEDTQQPDVSVSTNDELSVDEDESAVSTPQDEVAPPEYVDESKYSGDELEIVKLMNTRMRYLYEQDEKGYMSLFAPESPISGMPNYTFRKIISMGGITITEQKKLYQGVVIITELEDDIESSSTMVFWKWKADGEHAKWIIADID
ncbi:hypothetical protein EC604_16225 [Paenibacillus amylolyticus]|jgi:hypothetical protein|uniref:Nuclear transport factor 2 family protein n=1 Tax=Paenibacillus amylolyticus TaxID=1451 RepID=A0A5M9WV25_PAEAM|nr:hypothetical protein [Paenibacillus amylolyticus]KAA8785392.1 hypothetical protein EC604_16225 [Paenibacillus amylolyticus]